MLGQNEQQKDWTDWRFPEYGSGKNILRNRQIRDNRLQLETAKKISKDWSFWQHHKTEADNFLSDT